MAKYLIAVALGVVTIFLAIWILRDDTPIDPDADLLVPRSGDPRASRTESLREINRTPSPASASSNAAPAPIVATESANGKLVVRLRSEDPSLLFGLKLELSPAAGREGREADGTFLVEDLPAGSYMVTVHGGEIVARVVRGLVVRSGEETAHTLDIERGVRPRGRVFDALTKNGIPHAVVVFGDERLVADEHGQFASEPILPMSALRLITCSAADYDTIVFKQMVIPDPGDIQLGLGGGGGSLRVRLDRGGEGEAPKRVRARILINPAEWQVRRDHTFLFDEPIEFKNLFMAEYRLEVSFPDGEFPNVNLPFEIKPEKLDVDVAVPLIVGPRVFGKLVGPKELTGAGFVVELVSMPRGVVVGKTETDAKGAYEFKNVRPGAYIARLVSAGTARQLPDIKIEPGSEDLERDIDVLRHVYIEKK